MCSITDPNSFFLAFRMQFNSERETFFCIIRLFVKPKLLGNNNSSCIHYVITNLILRKQEGASYHLTPDCYLYNKPVKNYGLKVENQPWTALGFKTRPVRILNVNKYLLYSYASGEFFTYNIEIKWFTTNVVFHFTNLFLFLMNSCFMKSTF